MHIAVLKQHIQISYFYLCFVCLQAKKAKLEIDGGLEEEPRLVFSDLDLFFLTAAYLF